MYNKNRRFSFRRTSLPIKGKLFKLTKYNIEKTNLNNELFLSLVAGLTMNQLLIFRIKVQRAKLIRILKMENGF
jgi:hypothetical protein